MENFPELLTIKETAAILKVSVNNVRSLCKRGVIKSTRAFGDFRIPAADLKQVIFRELNRPTLVRAA